MKSATLFAFRVVLLTIAFFAAFVIAASLTGMTQSAPSAAIAHGQAQQAADSLRPLLLYSLLVAAVFAWILTRSTWRGAKLIAAIAFTLYGLQTVISQIETLPFLRHKIPMLLLRKLFLLRLGETLLFAPASVVI